MSKQNSGNITDLALGLVGSTLPQSETVDHAVRYFNSWSGNDKLMMLLQYGSKLLIPILQRRAEIQFAAGKRAEPVSLSKDGLGTFASELSLTRRISGFWGILAIVRGLTALERNKSPSRFHLNIQRLQGLSMLAFYPLDFLNYFGSGSKPLLRGVSPKTAGLAGLWSVRAWAAYVALQIVASLRDLRDLVNAPRIDEVAYQRQKHGILCQLISDVVRVPVILHWSIIGGLYKNEFWTDFLSFVSGVVAFRGGWEASRIPPPPV